MTTLLSLLIVSVFTVDYFSIKLGLISRAFTLIPEIFSVLIAIILVGRAIAIKRWHQPRRYVWFFVAFFLVCMIGAVAQSVDPGPLISGLRNYFKFLPLFLLPAAYDFSDKQLRVVLGTFLVMAALQVPLAFFQRFVQFADQMHTGDPITGSVTVSSALTMVLCIAIALVITLYIHRKIALSLALLAFCFLAAPTAINETKATMLLLPVAVLGPFLLARGVEKKWRKAIPVLGICALGLVAFVVVYNTLIEARWGGTRITDFFAGARYEAYLYRGSQVGDFTYSVGRLDSMILPVKVLSDEWMQLLFGLGIGNVSPSSLPGMEGAYFEMGKEMGYGLTAIGNLIWETGVIGLSLYLFLFAMIWRDTRRCAFMDKDPASGWFYTWWLICVFIFVFGFAYKSVLQLNELGYMIFFWSGVMASRYWQLRNPEESARETAGQAAPRLQLAGQ
jgi:hypothetical protein